MKEMININDGEKMLDVYEKILSESKGLKPNKKL